MISAAIYETISSNKILFSEKF